MKLQHLLVSAALALAGSLASADPVQFSFDRTPETGPFTETMTFSVSQGALFYGSLLTSASDLGDLSISSLVISNGVTEFKYDTLNDGFDFASVVNGTTVTTIKGWDITHYTTTYAWNSVFLDVGDWTVTVKGDNVSDKLGGSLNVTLIDPPVEVPEPASLALVGIALAGLGVARRRAAR